MALSPAMIISAVGFMLLCVYVLACSVVINPSDSCGHWKERKTRTLEVLFAAMVMSVVLTFIAVKMLDTNRALAACRRSVHSPTGGEA